METVLMLAAQAVLLAGLLWPVWRWVLAKAKLAELEVEQRKRLLNRQPM